MSQQTSVEWLFYAMQKTPMNEWYRVLEQAKEMEKKQHSRTWDAALDACEKRGHVYVRAWEDFDEYYNEKFNNQ